MSYEGYEQLLCANGHYFTCDAYANVSYDENGPKESAIACPYCKAMSVWSNSVDQTNDPNQGFIDMKQFLLKDAEMKICHECNHSAQIAPAVYRIPTQKETIKARQNDYAVVTIEND